MSRGDLVWGHRDDPDAERGARVDDPSAIKVSHCNCGLWWAGGNSKYCPAGHASQFTTHTYVPAGSLFDPAASEEKLREVARKAMKREYAGGMNAWSDASVVRAIVRALRS